MQDIPHMDAADTKSRAEWEDRIDAIGEELGYFEPLGPNHSAFFVDEGPTLLVTFESAETIRQSGEGKMPLGYTIARQFGWSHLCIIAEGGTWYRDRAVYGYFDRLTDDAFFEDFDNVVFYGAGMGAYAATAFSVTAPGATVLAIQPVATLDPRVTEWDPRFRAERRLNFTDRYGYAPDMIEGAGEVFVLYDPEESYDAMHAALFTRPFVTKLRLRHYGSQIETVLRHLEVLPALIEAAGEGRLDGAAFWRLQRARRNYGPYLRALLARLDQQDRPVLAAALCRAVLSYRSAPQFRRRLEQLTEVLEARGLTLPERETEGA
ncbi:phosphoadenosine phosphosulfate reductase [Thioclava sp. BHET1]|nr:phosphoadenosine phosphosulfate reductase [Thioclava sp. BHET1]